MLRLNETLGRRGSTRLHLAPGWCATRVDLREQPKGSALHANTERIALDYTPYALLRVLIQRSQQAEFLSEYRQRGCLYLNSANRIATKNTKITKIKHYRIVVC